MSMSDLIIGSISSGEDNAVSLSELCRRTNEGERTVRLCIEDMRRKGAVICSSGKGYYLPSCTDELRRYVRTERARSRSIKKTLSAAEKLLRKWESEGGCNDK